MDVAINKLRLYWPLIKSLQTGLLLATGVAGFLSTRPHFSASLLIGFCLSLFFAISGSTILNMWYDHDIDARMRRTHMRSVAAGRLERTEVFRVGMAFSILGIGWAVAIAPLYGLIILAGWFIDVVVYTLWLKRRTCWSILWGGISGAMPILSGRALAVGEIELVGVLLALAVLFWIPTHTLTFSIKFLEDYRRAELPTFPETYGEGFTRAIIAASAVLAALSIGWASVLIKLSSGYLGVLAILTAGLLVLAFATLRIHSNRINLLLFRYASLYMLSAMVILSLQAFSW